jgi:Lrp/AsnC family transcriptional regulator for asnA, asnC and gidA
MATRPPSEPPTGLDELDRRILLELQEDGRRSYRDIGARVGVSAGTARTRALQLMADGTIEIVAHPDPWKLGFEFFALVGIHLNDGDVDVEEVADLLVAREEITYVALATTGYDILVEIAMEDARAFGHYKNDVLTKLPGVGSVEAFVLWDVRKVRYRLQSPDHRITEDKGNSDRTAR